MLMLLLLVLLLLVLLVLVLVDLNDQTRSDPCVKINHNKSSKIIGNLPEDCFPSKKMTSESSNCTPTCP